jgi:hypothetical protein
MHKTNKKMMNGFSNLNTTFVENKYQMFAPLNFASNSSKEKHGQHKDGILLKST